MRNPTTPAGAAAGSAAAELLSRRRRALEGALTEVRGDLEGEVGWSPRGSSALLVMLAASAGFALAGWRFRKLLAGRTEERSSETPGQT